MQKLYVIMQSSVEMELGIYADGDGGGDGDADCLFVAIMVQVFWASIGPEAITSSHGPP